MSPKHRSCRALEVVSPGFHVLTMHHPLSYDDGSTLLFSPRFSSPRQIGGSLRAAEIHWVHVKEGGTTGSFELLVVGVLFDVSEYGTNVEVRPHGRKT